MRSSARFLEAGAADLPSVALMTDAEAALDRIERAIDQASRSRSGATTTPMG